GATCSGPSEGAPEGSCGVSLDADGGGVSTATVPEGRVMLEFVSRTCTVCQRMAPVVAAAEHDCAGRGVSVSRVDVSEPNGAALARQFNVRGVPTFVFLDSRNEVARLVGEQPLAMLEQSLEVLTGQKCDAFRKLPAAGG
ncbi:MAG: thioredoxin family protein, partial [Myxococcaceae bacterium]